VCAAIGAVAPGAATVEHVVDYDVLVDYADLVKGTEWPQQLNLFMSRCHAGLLLLTPNAVASDWVRTEATILRWRQAVEPSFRLFIVRDPAVSDADLKANGWDPIRISDVQLLASTEANAIAAEVHGEFPAGSPPASLFDRTRMKLMALLRSADQSTLWAVANHLSPGQPAPAGDDDALVKRQYVDVIATRLLAGNPYGDTGITTIVDELRTSTLPVDDLAKIVYLIAPLWVDASAAGRLLGQSILDPPGAAAINGNHVLRYSGYMYVCRAHPLSTAFQYIDIPGAHAGDFVDHVRDQVCRKVRDRRPGSTESDDDIIERLKHTPSVYIAVSEVPLPDELVDLRTLFPKATLIFDAGPELSPVEGLERVDWLRPELDAVLESRQFASYNGAENVLRNPLLP
jgi:hypothetical protein